MLALDIIVICLLTVAMLTGLRCLHTNQHYFEQFSTTDLIKGRRDARAYVIVMCSTAICALDTFLRIYWVVDIGWSSAGGKWNLLWLSLHLAISLLTIYVHSFLDNLIKEMNE